MKLIIVDLDGTLIDTEIVNYLSYKEALSEVGIELEKEYFLKKCNGKHYQSFLSDITGNNEAYIEIVHNRKKELYKNHLNEARLNEHLATIIRVLKDNAHIALVTTASKENVLEALEQFQIESLFDLIISGEDVSKRKPDPEGFFIAMRHFQAAAKDTIIFEDSEEGIEAALQTGADVYRVMGYRGKIEV